MFKAFSKIYNGKSRHISLRHEYIKQLISDRIIIIAYNENCPREKRALLENNEK